MDEEEEQKEFLSLDLESKTSVMSHVKDWECNTVTALPRG